MTCGRQTDYWIKSHCRHPPTVVINRIYIKLPSHPEPDDKGSAVCNFHRFRSILPIPWIMVYIGSVPD
jgi:hypothetical protein